MLQDTTNAIGGNTNFLAQSFIRDLAFKRNGIPDIVMIKDTKDRNVIFFLARILI